MLRRMGMMKTFDRLSSHLNPISVLQLSLVSAIIFVYIHLKAYSQEPSIFDSILPIKFLIIGERKCGTSTLYTTLCSHPQVVCSLKEPMYFSRHADKPIEWYANIFPKRDYSNATNCYPWVEWDGHKYKTLERCSNVDLKKPLFTGEASAQYLQEADPAKVLQTLPHTKIIVMVREPVSRTISHLKMLKRFGHRFEVNKRIKKEISDLNACVERFGKKCFIDVGSNIVAMGVYGPIISKWKSIFKGKLKVVEMEKLAEEIRGIFNFLDLKPVDVALSRRENVNRDKLNVKTETIQELSEFFEHYS